MTRQTHVLIDSRQAVLRDGAEVAGQEKDAGAIRWKVRMRTCRGGRSDGVQVVELDNGRMTIDVLPTRGMGIWRVRRGEKVLGWRSPAHEPVHPSFVPLFEPSGLGWLDGFNELLCRCGLESNGAPDFDDSGKLLYPLHGRIANLPVHYMELEFDENANTLKLRGVVDESRFHFQSLRLTTAFCTRIGSNEFSWTDEVENIGGRDASMQMLYHFNIGQPVLQPGSRVIGPVATVAPWTEAAAEAGIEDWNVMPQPRPGSAEQGYLLDLLADSADQTQVLVDGLADEEAISLRFNKRALPCFTVWRNTAAEADGYVLGIEPATNFPNPHSFERRQGRVVSLQPGEKWQAEVTATWHADAGSAAEVRSAIEVMQRKQSPEAVPRPRMGWSANA